MEDRRREKPHATLARRVRHRDRRTGPGSRIGCTGPDELEDFWHAHGGVRQAVGWESEGRRLAVRGPECCNVRDGHYPADVDRPAPHAGRDRSEKANRSGLGAGLQGHEGAGARAGEKSRPGGQQVRPVHRSRSRRKRERQWQRGQMMDKSWNPWKVTALFLALVMATALVTGLVVANWSGSSPESAPMIAAGTRPAQPARATTVKPSTPQVVPAVRAARWPEAGRARARAPRSAAWWAPEAARSTGSTKTSSTTSTTARRTRTACARAAIRQDDPLQAS